MKNRTHARTRRALLPLLAALLLQIIAFGPASAQTDPTPPSDVPPSAVPPPEVTATPEVTGTPVVYPPGDRRFGVIESFEDPAAAGRLGIGWTRIRFQWADVQPDGPDDWEPPIDDETLAAELAAGREVVGLLIGIPEWARAGNDLPRDLSLPPDDPGNTWAVFVDDVVGRYAGRIDHWIIWNEPDIDDPDAPGHTWDGTIEEFFQLQRTAYLTAKAANPEAVIHLGAFTYFWDPGYFSRFLDVAAADPDAATSNYYFDVATAHLYFQPNAVYNVLYAFRRALDNHDLEQPIWLVETNAPPMNDPYWEVDNWTLAVTLNEQAAFIPQAIAAAMAAGVDRIAVYKLKDTEGDYAANPEPFGLIRWDDSRRPAYNTYRVAIGLLGGVTAAERERWDAVGQVRLEQGDASTTVLFARLPGPQVARVRAEAESAALVDMWGERETIDAEAGYFTVELPGALCSQTIADYCMIGGTTYYLIQEASGERPGRPLAEETQSTTDDNHPREEMTPTPRPSPAVELSPTGEPSATAEPSVTRELSPTATLTAPSATPYVVAALPPGPDATVATVLDTAIAEAPNSAGGVAAPPDYLGLVVLGLGLVLGAGMAGWWLIGRRGAG